MGQHSEVTILIRAKDYASGVFASISSGSRQLKQAFFSLQGQMIAFGTAFATLGLAKYLIDVNREYGKLMTQLQTFQGMDAAPGVFKELAHFAAVTPFQITETVEAFIKLRSAGITPSMETLRLFGDHAAAFGGKINDFAAAVRSATVGEERALREYGVTMMVHGDKLAASFQGNTQMIGRDAASIVHYLEDISRKNFAGGMERQSKTLDGAISNLMDSIESLARAIGDAGFTSAVVDITRKLTHWTEGITENDGAIRKWVGYIADSFPIAGAWFNVIGAWMDATRLRWQLFTTDLTDRDAWNGVKTQLNEANDAVSKALSGMDSAYAKRATNAEKNALGSEKQQRIRALKGLLEADQATPAQMREYLKLTETTSGLPTTTIASTHANTPEKKEKKTKDEAALLTDYLKLQADAAKQHAELSKDVNFANFTELYNVEQDIDNAIAHGNLGLKERLELEKIRYDIEKQRKELGLLTLEERVNAQTKDILDRSIAASLPDAATIDYGVQQAIHGKDANGNSVGGFDDKGRQTGQGRLADISNAMKDAIGQGQTLNNIIADMTTHTFQAFGDAVTSAFAAFVDGSANAGQAFAGAMLGALGAVASGFGQFFMARATGELAAGIGALSNPITAPLAGGHFASAAQWSAGAFAMFALAGVLSGAGNRVAGGGGGGSRASASSNNSTLQNQKGDAELIIEGGFLDMNDPRTEASFARAMQSLTGRRVTVRRTR
jgi:hypothetical protein